MDPIFTQQFNMPPPQAPSGGMFGGGGKFGIAQAIVAALNGYLAGTAGPGREVGLNNMQMMAAMRQKQLERQQEIADYNRTRADNNSDYLTHLQQKAQYEAPAGSEYERLLAAAGIAPGTPEYQKHVSAKVNQLENPMVMTPYGPMPYSAVNPPVPTAPVGKLTPIGGPTPGGSGGFS